MTNGIVSPGQTVTPTSVDPRREYVASGWGFGASRPTVLSWAIDEDAATLGDDLYERMTYDPQVRACVNVLKAAILDEGARISSALDDSDADGYDQARDIALTLERNLDDLTIPFDDVLWNLLDAMAYGNKVSEQVYALDATYTGRQQLVLRALKVKPRRATGFVVDPYYNVLGLVAHVPGRNATLALNGSRPENLLPRDKFAIVTFRPIDSDPRGSSILRAALQPWAAKVDTWPEYLKYLAQFATPSIWGTPPEGAQNYTDPDSGEVQTAEEVLLSALLTFKNGTALAVPAGTKLELVFSEGEGEAFLNAFKLYDQQITKAILHQTLATEEGEHQARSAAEVHQDVLGTIVQQIKQGTELAIRRDVVRPWVRYNYGDKALQLLPRLTLGDVDKIDFVATANAIANLATDYLDPSQYPEIDRSLGLPVRTASLGDRPPVEMTEPEVTDDEDVEE